MRGQTRDIDIWSPDGTCVSIYFKALIKLKGSRSKLYPDNFLICYYNINNVQFSVKNKSKNSCYFFKVTSSTFRELPVLRPVT